MRRRWLCVLIALFTGAFAAAQQDDGDAPAGEARIDRLAERLALLSPESPALYLELGEEVAAGASTDEAIGLARRLYVLALTSGLDAGDRAIAGGACLALAEIAETERERRWLIALARNADDRVEAQSDERAAVPSKAGLDASAALTRVRAGDGRIARRALERPEIRRAIEAHAPDAWIAHLDSEARRWPCPECRGDRFVPDPDRPGAVRLCATCSGNPGPVHDRAGLLEHLRVEAALLGVSANSWSAQLAMGRGDPLREADPREVAPYYAIDPARACWRDDRWVICPEGEDAP